MVRRAAKGTNRPNEQKIGGRRREHPETEAADLRPVDPVAAKGNGGRAADAGERRPPERRPPSPAGDARELKRAEPVSGERDDRRAREIQLKTTDREVVVGESAVNGRIAQGITASSAGEAIEARRVRSREPTTQQPTQPNEQLPVDNPLPKQ